MVWFAVETAVQHGFVEHGDIVLVLAGAPGSPQRGGDRRAARRAGRMTGPIWSEEAGPDDAPLVVLVHGSMDRSAGLLKLSRRLDGDAPRAALRPARLRPLDAAPRSVRDRRAGRRPRRPARRSAGGAVRAQLRGQRRPRPGRPAARPGASRGGLRVAAVVARLVAADDGGRRRPGGGRRPGRRRRAVHAPADRRRAVASACRRAPGGPGAPRAWRWSASSRDLQSHAPWEPDAVTVPAVAIHGTRGAAHHGASTGLPRAGAGRLPVVEIDGARHFGPNTHPDAVAAVLDRAGQPSGDVTVTWRPKNVHVVSSTAPAASVAPTRSAQSCSVARCAHTTTATAATTARARSLESRSGRPRRRRWRRRPPRPGSPAQRRAPPRTSTRPREHRVDGRRACPDGAGRSRCMVPGSERASSERQHRRAEDRRGRCGRAGRVPSLGMTDERPIAMSHGLPSTVLPAPDPSGPRASSTGRWQSTISTAGGRRSPRSSARHPRFLDAWAELGDAGRDDIERYAYYRVGYHRGLDALRANGWRGSGYVRWSAPTNRGFLRSLAGLGGDGRADRRARRGRAHRHVPRPARPRRVPAGIVTAGAVLCGGASRRMGTDKAFVEVGGVAMAERVAAALEAAGCAPVVLRRRRRRPACPARPARARRSMAGRGSRRRRAHRARRDARRRRRRRGLRSGLAAAPIGPTGSSPRPPRRRTPTSSWRTTDRLQPGLALWRRHGRGRTSSGSGPPACAPVHRLDRGGAVGHRRRRCRRAAQRQHDRRTCRPPRRSAGYIGPVAVSEIDVDELAERLAAGRPGHRRARAGRVHRRTRAGGDLDPAGDGARATSTPSAATVRRT